MCIRRTRHRAQMVGMVDATSGASSLLFACRMRYLVSQAVSLVALLLSALYIRGLDNQSEHKTSRALEFILEGADVNLHARDRRQLFTPAFRLNRGRRIFRQSPNRPRHHKALL